MRTVATAGTSGGRTKGPMGDAPDAPTATKSMRIALDDLGLSRLYVVYPGERRERGEG